MGRTLHLPRDPELLDDSTPSAETILAQGAVPQRRATLSILCEVGALSLETLAERVATRLGRRESDAPGAPTSEEVYVSLYHNHLHHLSETGLVVHDDETGVALHSNVDEHRVRTLLESGTGDWDALGAILSEERRERVVTILASQDEPMAVDELATAVVAFADAVVDGPQQAIDSTTVSLHHVDLPKLEEAGVVDYDPETGQVEIGSVPAAYDDAKNGANAVTV